MWQVWEYVKIALSNIKTNKGRSFLTMLGIIIGISSVIMIISIGNGVKGGITTELNSMAGGQLYIYFNEENDDGAVLYFTDEDAEAILEKIPHVKAATPDYSIYGSITGRKGQFTGQLELGNPGLQYAYSDPIIKGRYFDDNDYYSGSRVCIVSEFEAMKLFGTTNVIGMTVEANIYSMTREFTIIGIRQDNASVLSGMMSSNAVSLEVPMSVATDSFGFNIYSSSLLIVTEGSTYATQVLRETIALMENRHDIRGKNAIGAQSFDDQLASFNEIIGYITIFVVFVAAISLLVGGIGVMNIMLVSVTERTREIGIRKALGARTGSILLQFLSESAIITLLGGVIGITIGVLGANLVCGLMGFSATPDIQTILLASLFSSGIGLFFGIYPARKAAKMSPIEALRRE
jgi:putative ABC transport system permease protein